VNIIKIPASKIKTPPLLVRGMDDEEFQALVRSIGDLGYVEPIQVVKDCDGSYRLVNGFHRLKALTEVYGKDEIETLVISEMCCEDGKREGCWDELRYDIEIVRLNNIKGKWITPALIKHLDKIFKEAEAKGMSREEVLLMLGDKREIIKRLMPREKSPQDEKKKLVKSVCSQVMAEESESGAYLVFAVSSRLVLVYPLRGKDELYFLASFIDDLASRGESLVDFIKRVIGAP